MFIVIFATQLLLDSLIGAQSGPSGNREEFTAAALSAGGSRSGAVATNVDIVIERWSTAAERQRLIDSMRKGQSAMLETLRDLRAVGTIRTPGNLAWDLHYAHQMPGEDGGRRIFIATDRPVGVWEAINQPRTIDYPFTFIELRVDPSGAGEGKLSRATRVIASSDGRFVELENWSNQPVELTQVRRRER